MLENVSRYYAKGILGAVALLEEFIADGGQVPDGDLRLLDHAQARLSDAIADAAPQTGEGAQRGQRPPAQPAQARPSHTEVRPIQGGRVQPPQSADAALTRRGQQHVTEDDEERDAGLFPEPKQTGRVPPVRRQQQPARPEPDNPQQRQPQEGAEQHQEQGQEEQPAQHEPTQEELRRTPAPRTTPTQRKR